MAGNGPNKIIRASEKWIKDKLNLEGKVPGIQNKDSDIANNYIL